MSCYSSKTFFCASLLAAFFVTASVASAEIVRTIEKKFDVNPGGKLVVDASAAQVTVVPGKGNVVTVTTTLKFPTASTEAEADKIADKLSIDIAKSGNDVLASVKSTDKFVFSSRTKVRISVNVVVPESYNLDLKTSGGDINVGDVAGQVTARTSGGDVNVGHIKGVVNAKTSGGDIELLSCTESAVLNTSGGNIDAGDINGDLDAGTSGGHIKIENVAGAMKAKTSGGSIKAEFTKCLPTQTNLSTSGGNVSVRLKKNYVYTLDASTSGGKVTAKDVTITTNGTIKRSSLSGTVNGGGALVKLRTSGGNISIEAE